jgi:hypothetical protein
MFVTIIIDLKSRECKLLINLNSMYGLTNEEIKIVKYGALRWIK